MQKKRRRNRLRSRRNRQSLERQPAAQHRNRVAAQQNQPRRNRAQPRQLQNPARRSPPTGHQSPALRNPPTGLQSPGRRNPLRRNPLTGHRNPALRNRGHLSPAGTHRNPAHRNRDRTRGTTPLQLRRAWVFRARRARGTTPTRRSRAWDGTVRTRAASRARHARNQGLDAREVRGREVRVVPVAAAPVVVVREQLAVAAVAQDLAPRVQVDSAAVVDARAVAPEQPVLLVGVAHAANHVSRSARNVKSLSCSQRRQSAVCRFHAVTETPGSGCVAAPR